MKNERKIVGPSASLEASGHNRTLRERNLSLTSIKLFGRLDVADPDGTLIPVTGGKQQALLAVLALAGDQPLTRNKLVNLLWGDRFDDQARQSLRQAVSKLRQILNRDGADVLWANADQVGLTMDSVDIDTHVFENLARTGAPESLYKAEALYTDALLDGFSAGGEIDEWLGAERVRLGDLACKVFSQCADLRVQDGESAGAVEMAQRLIALDPLREPSHRQLMRILAQSGQRAAALRQYKTCAALLKSELDVEPEGETQRLLQEIRGDAPAAEPSDANLETPAPSSPFFGATSATSRPAISVLPFSLLGGGDDTDFMGEAMTEDLTTALSKYRWLSVVAPDVTSTGAEYAVEGSLRKSGNRLRLTAHLIDLTSRKYLWVQRYDREVDDVFAIQDELVETIAATVESELTSFEGERARHIDNRNMSAWDCYHLGLSTQYEFGKESNGEAQDLFRRAIALDPNFGAAYARLSYAMVISTIYFEADEKSDLLDEALELAKKATRMDDQDAIAQFALGRAHLARGEYDKSVVALETATRLNPTMAQAHCGLGDSLAYAGRLDESVAKFEEAVRLSPNDPYRWAFLMYGAVAHLFARDFEKSADWGTQATRVPNSHYWANAVQTAALAHLERKAEAEEARAELLRLNPDFTCSFARDRLFYLQSDEQRELYVEGLRKAGVPD